MKKWRCEKLLQLLHKHDKKNVLFNSPLSCFLHHCLCVIIIRLEIPQCCFQVHPIFSYHSKWCCVYLPSFGGCLSSLWKRLSHLSDAVDAETKLVTFSTSTMHHISQNLEIRWPLPGAFNLRIVCTFVVKEQPTTQILAAMNLICLR